MFTDIEQRMVKPMKAAFQKGDRESGLRIFINYVLDDPNAWQKMPQDAHKDMLAHAHEWDVMMTSGELFPKIESQAIRGITTPTLLLSGEKSYPFLGLIETKNLPGCSLMPAGSFCAARRTGCGLSSRIPAATRCWTFCESQSAL
jgi:hypothetical protein